ncbi:MAG: DUF6475 domain-containing protein [Gammaproteobacteria bacterium]
MKRYKASLDEDQIETYWQTLKEFTESELEAALYAHYRYPGIGHRVPDVSDLMRHIRGDGEVKALLAWTRLWQLVRRIGQYNSIVLDDFILQKVIEDMGGWVHLCRMTEKDLNFRLSEFKKRYAAYVLNPPTEYPRQLTGVFDWQNQLLGYPNQPPLLIGNAEIAKQVYYAGYDTPAHLSYQPLLLASPEE